jgi:DHA1 family tetracycline resistance protein-like MFS transporter
VILVSLTASCTGYLLFAFTHSLTVLFASRVIAGIGGANIGTAQAYIADSTSPENRAKGMGLIGAAFGLGFILGPPMSIVLAAIGTKFGLAGNLLPGLVAAGLSFTAFLIALGVLAESKPKDLVPRSKVPPQFDRRLWREIASRPLLASVMLALFLTLLAVAGMEVTVTLHGRDRFHFGQREIGFLFIFMGVIVAAIQGGLIGRIVKRVGEEGAIVIAAASFTIGFVLVPSVWRVPLLYVVAFLIAIGQGLSYPALTAMLSKIAPENERGSLLGMATAIGSLARFLGPLLSGFLYDLAGAPGAFYGGSLFMAASLFIALRMRRTSRYTA